MGFFGLVMEHDKLEIFHFSRAHNNTNPELNLSAIGTPILRPKTYILAILGLLLWLATLIQGVHSILLYQGTVHYEGDGHAWQLHSRSASSSETTSLLVLCCTNRNLWFLSLVLCWSTYQGTSFSLGNHATQGCPLDLGAFYTSPTGGIEALAGLIPIHLHFKKLVKQSCLRAATLPSQHALMSLLSACNSKGTCPHSQSLALLTNAQNT